MDKEKSWKLSKISSDMDKRLEDLAINRIKRGLDRKPKSKRELTKMMVRNPKFKMIEEELLRESIDTKRIFMGE